jgi:chorismate dehydratase
LNKANRYRLTAVSYWNTKPYIHGINEKGLGDLFDISLDIPSEGARKLLQREVDLGLVPVASMLKDPEISPVLDWGISCKGPVETVALFSEKPIEDLDTIYLDYHSESSVRLLRILLDKHWQLNPVLETAQKGYREQISGIKGGLVIGDRAMDLSNRFEYVYDLGEHWYDFAGLPFVFALWCSPFEIPLEILQKLDEALGWGVQHLNDLDFNEYAEANSSFDMKHYLNHSIRYRIGDAEKAGLEKFLDLAANYKEKISLL